jgi:hypothetical protein
MDISLITAATGTQVGAAQVQIAATLLKNNADLERSTVLTLLGGGSQTANPLANVGSGVGGSVDVTA